MLYDLKKESERPGFDELAKPITVTLDPIDAETIGATFEAYFQTLAIMNIPVPEHVKQRAANVISKIITELAKQGKENVNAQASGELESHASIPPS